MKHFPTREKRWRYHRRSDDGATCGTAGADVEKIFLIHDPDDLTRRIRSWQEIAPKLAAAAQYLADGAAFRTQRQAQGLDRHIRPENSSTRRCDQEPQGCSTTHLSSRRMTATASGDRPSRQLRPVSLRPQRRSISVPTRRNRHSSPPSRSMRLITGRMRTIAIGSKLSRSGTKSSLGSADQKPSSSRAMGPRRSAISYTNVPSFCGFYHYGNLVKRMLSLCRRYP